MYLKKLELSGFKSFAKKTELSFDTPITAIVGPNGSGKSNVAEAMRWVLGEQSMKSLRGKRGEDLIFNGSKSAGRTNRASVEMVFDNSARQFNIDFDEVAVKREVLRDGSNNYYINGSPVRLKDVYELLSSVSLGASSHHIISQGEADRILNASPKERRSMIEDALGLKIFQYKKLESERKLAKTEENIKEAQSLRRELAPHIRFLKKQVEQIEKAAEIKKELIERYQEYFSIEETCLAKLESEQTEAKKNLEDELRGVNTALEQAQEKIDASDEGETQLHVDIRNLEKELDELRSQKDERARELGRLEGQLLAVPAESHIEKKDGKDHCRYCGQEVTDSGHEDSSLHKEKIEEIKKEKESVEASLKKIEGDEKEKREELAGLKKKLDEMTTDVRRSDRELFDKKTTRNTLQSDLNRIEADISNRKDREDEFKREIGEGGVLVGREATDYSTKDVVVDDETSRKQKDRKREIERLKIRLEDMGAGGEDVMKEFEDTTKRDAHLENEIADLEKSKESLVKLMDDLVDTLEKKFKDGMGKINKEFTKFFSLLFGGGEAGLSITILNQKKEDELLSGESEKEDFGIEISINLPRKKIRGLEMLSGGERALTSIALVFAMSQVNPPPFMVLDETDAALDEANSKRYSDMVESLSDKSQLILITHNRESMSRAQVLYGVTMSADSVSRLLSIKFDEAQSYAK